MSNEELQKLVEELSTKYFLRPFLHRASFNFRLRTVGGRYLTKSHNIELNYKSYEAYGLEELISIIKHELCHYHLHLQGKRYSHKDKNFRECLEHSGGSRYCKPLSSRNQPYRYVLVCKKCKQEYYRKRKMNPNIYRCGKCKGELILKYIEKSQVNPEKS